MSGELIFLFLGKGCEEMLIATLPPYVSHRDEIVGNPLVAGLRFNTVMPIGESRNEVLARLQRECGSKPLWVDLKTRQLRITKFAYLPYAFVEISRRIKVNLPVPIFFKDCVSEIVEIVDGNKLILSKRPVRVVGAGEPVGILDPSLEIEGFLTEGDVEYIEAAKKLGIHNYMLSFVEKEDDVQELLAIDPEAMVVAKIESQRGLRFVDTVYSRMKQSVTLMAARDDLFIQLGEDKAGIIEATKKIISRDKNAILASQILSSLEESDNVSLADISDMELMKRLRYRNFMLGDTLCFQGNSFRNAIRVLGALRA